MHTRDLSPYQHSHSFGQEQTKAGERRTLVVIGITAVAMVVEIVAGIAYGSMALLADGLHMASHAAALFIVAIAYAYARKRAHDERFAFGTGKVNALAGYSGAVLLAIFSLAMGAESIERLLSPVEIQFSQAILVAFVGLVVNIACALILMGGKVGGHGHAHGDHGHAHGGSHEDHNLRSAYLHVLADGLTSLAAILALVVGRYFGAHWMDPVMGIVGSILVARWSVGLLRDSARVLLDHQAPQSVREEIATALENDDDRVADLHVWSIGPGLRAAEITLVTHQPRPPEHYRALVPEHAQIVHCTVEVRRCSDAEPPEDGKEDEGKAA